jgi:hypothetical protein
MTRNNTLKDKRFNIFNPVLISWTLLFILVTSAVILRLGLVDVPLQRDEGEYAYAGRHIQGIYANSEHFVILFATIGLYLLIANQKRKLLRFFLSGLILGIAFIMKQHGAVFLLFGSTYLLKDGRIAWLIIGIGATVELYKDHSDYNWKPEPEWAPISKDWIAVFKDRRI